MTVTNALYPAVYQAFDDDSWSVNICITRQSYHREGSKRDWYLPHAVVDYALEVGVGVLEVVDAEPHLISHRLEHRLLGRHLTSIIAVLGRSISL